MTVCIGNQVFMTLKHLAVNLTLRARLDISSKETRGHFFKLYLLKVKQRSR